MSKQKATTTVTYVNYIRREIACAQCKSRTFNLYESEGEIHLQCTDCCCSSRIGPVRPRLLSA